MLSYMCAHDHLPFVKYLSVGSPSEPQFISISTPLPSQKILAKEKQQQQQQHRIHVMPNLEFPCPFGSSANLR